MATLLPGYPQSNPILKGVSDLEGGKDLERVLEERDRALVSAFSFAQATLEAGDWIHTDSPLLETFLDQALNAFLRTTDLERQQLLHQARSKAEQGSRWAQRVLAVWDKQESGL